MTVSYKLDGSLPRLAWCAEVARGGTVTVTHGEWVETHRQFFTDGAWEGAFAAGDLADAQLLMGFGAVVRDGKVVFCTPCHTLERLHLVEDGSRIVISPSMAFVLAVTNCRLDVAHIPYQADLGRFVRRPEEHVGRLRLAEGRTMMLVHYRNVEIDKDLSVRICPKAEPPDFGSFHEYKAYLSKGLKGIVANAADRSRRICYTPLATISSGYDSTGCAALAAEAGCREAVTFRTARRGSGSDSEPSDSGASIGRQLGMTVREDDRGAYLEAPGVPEAEFVVCGDLGQEVPWIAFSNAFERRLVISGTHGDVVWDRRFRPSRRGIVRGDMSGCSLVEFRSRVGFLYVLPAFFGSWSHPSIYAISNSTEMEPWRVGGRYDRPIPRRIAEEKGVSRGAFGQKKRAVAVLLNEDANLDRFMQRESRADFEQFYQRHRRLRPSLRQALYSALFTLRRWHGAFVQALPPLRVMPSPISERFRRPPGRPSFLVHWAMPLVQRRYLAVTDGNRCSRQVQNKDLPTGGGR